jgi:hypothetical protein
VFTSRFRHAGKWFLGEIQIESRGLSTLVSRLRWLRLIAVSGHQLDRESAGQIPANMIGRFLDDCDLQRLHRMLIKKKQPAP